MSKDEADTKPAFPEKFGNVPGMHLRDYFAGQYLAGRAAHKPLTYDYMQAVAENAYMMADIMMKARQL